MDSVAHVNVPLRGGKKMKKRKELDALVAHAINKRCVDVKRSPTGVGVSSHDQLLSDSTDEQDYWTSSTGAKPLRCHRRRYSIQRRTCSAVLRACSGILIFSCVVATTTVMWLFIDIREQVTSLRTELNQVVAGSQGVPDALQKCHSLSRELQKNQSQIMERLRGFSALLNNFSSEMTEVRNGLHAVQDQLKSSPDLVSNPTLVKDLSTSVASFGSQIKDLGATVSFLKEQNNKLDSIIGNLVVNVTEMRAQVNELLTSSKDKSSFTARNFAVERENIMSVINEASANVSILNQTLTKHLQWAVNNRSYDQNLLDDIQETNKSLALRMAALEKLCAKGLGTKNGFDLKSFPNASEEGGEKFVASVPSTPMSSAPSPKEKSSPSQANVSGEEDSKSSQNPP